MNLHADRSDRFMATLFAAYCLVLVALWLALSPAAVRHAFSEDGIFERISVVGWIIAAIVVATRTAMPCRRGAAFVLLYLVFAAREADLHKAFTADSIFKSAYYRRGTAPFEEKLMAAIIALALLALLAYVMYASVRFLVLESGWRTRSGVWLASGLGLLCFTKVIDRAPAVLHDEFGLMLPASIGLLVSVVEEGLESFLPVIFGWSAWVSPAGQGYLSPHAGHWPAARNPVS